ncbi:hypothetical protein BMS3Abin01_00601 [bacterium BMS3Abin01]|nr:hypothetical protein BMS3Abin01_00601 [bacterium BMS3Abin01]
MKIIVTISRLLLIIVLLSLTSLASLAVWGCGDNTQGSRNTVDAAFDNLSQAESYRLDMDLALEMNGDLSKVAPEAAAVLPLALDFRAVIDADLSDLKDLRMRIHDIRLDGLDKMLRDLASTSGGTEAQGAMMAGMVNQMLEGTEVVFIGTTYYFNFAGSWYELPLDNLARDAQQKSGDVVDMDCLMDKYQNLYSADNLMSAYMENPSVLVDLRKVGSADIDGVSTGHFQAAVDGQKMTDMMNTAMQDYMDAMRECGMPQDTGVDDMDQEMQDFMDAMQSAFDASTVELWIDEDDNIRRYRMDMNLDMGELARTIGDDSDARDLETMTLKITTTLKYSAFGEDMGIEAPSDTLPFEDLLNLFGGNSLDDLKVSQVNA